MEESGKRTAVDSGRGCNFQLAAPRTIHAFRALLQAGISEMGMSALVFLSKSSISSRLGRLAPAWGYWEASSPLPLKKVVFRKDRPARLKSSDTSSVTFTALGGGESLLQAI